MALDPPPGLAQPEGMLTGSMTVFDRTPLGALGLALLVAMVLAYLGGARLHAWLERTEAAAPGTAAPDQGIRRSDQGAVLSGVFGLLALLMAFAFSLAIGRYEHRRQLALDEANAFGTMASRLGLLDEAQRAPLARLLGTYARARAEAGRVPDDAEWEAAVGRAATLGTMFGDHLIGTLRTMPPDTRGPVLVSAWNSLGDIATARHAERSARLPAEVLMLLALYCCAGAGILGYGPDASSRRHAAAALALFVLLCAAYVTVLDLDRPRAGAIVVPQGELDTVAAALP